MTPRRGKPELPHIVLLDEEHARPAHPYTPEGQIRMMGDLAAAMRRRGGGMRPVALVLLLLILLPFIVGGLALVL